MAANHKTRSRLLAPDASFRIVFAYRETRTREN